MMNEKFIQEYGQTVFDDIFREISASRDVTSFASYCNGTQIKAQIKHLKQSAFGSYCDLKQNISFDFELLFGKHGQVITYFHKNNTNTITNQQTIKTKECICKWELVRSQGCKCGAIKPYKFSYT